MPGLQGNNTNIHVLNKIAWSMPAKRSFSFPEIQLTFPLQGVQAVTYEQFLLRAANNLQYRDGHEVSSAVTGGPRRARPSRRPLFFSRRINGGSRSHESVEGNAEGARLPR